jgi:hypothetical protein
MLGLLALGSVAFGEADWDAVDWDAVGATVEVLVIAGVGVTLVLSMAGIDNF